MFHVFFSSLSKTRYLYLFSFLSILPCGLLRWKSSLFSRFSFLLTIIRSSRLAEIKWSVYISKSQRILCVSFSRTDSGLYIYHLFVWLNFNFWYNSAHSFVSSLTHFVLICCILIMWLNVSSLLPHHLHRLFCCVLSILALIWLVLMALCCAAIRRDLVSLLRLPFHSHVQVFSCEISLVCRLKC